MKRTVVYIYIAVVAFSCNPKRNIPDVSNIKIQLDTLRFDRDFFAMDTSQLETSLDNLQKKYPEFINDYLFNLLAVPMDKDSTLTKVKLFIHDYKPVFDSVSAKYPSIAQTTDEVKRAMQFVKHYFPSYKLPQSLITFIGPLEGYSNVLTSSGFAVGLQLYLGKYYPAYNTDYIADVYPQYQSRRFEAGYIAVNCIKNIVTDIYPDTKTNLPLAYQMVEAGKRMYVLDYLMPETPDSIKTGYTQKQLDGCYAHEALIWNYFVQNDNLLYVTDPGQTKDYMADGPKTEELGDGSPGFIGQFVGWQIVKKWMQQDAKRSLRTLLQTPPKQIFEEAKYKPR
jgi:hypothetical protein